MEWKQQQQKEQQQSISHQRMHGGGSKEKERQHRKANRHAGWAGVRFFGWDRTPVQKHYRWNYVLKATFLWEITPRPTEGPTNFERQEKELKKKQGIIRLARRIVNSDGIDILHKKKIHGPRILAIVTPPVDLQNLPDNDDDDQDPHVYRRATEIARKAYDDYHSHQSNSLFDFTVWVDAEDHTHKLVRLKDILRQLQDQAKTVTSSSPDDAGKDDGDEEMRLQKKIQKHLTGKKFLIFLANHQDNTPWTQILAALPNDATDKSAIVVTPLVQQPFQYLGCTVSNARNMTSFCYDDMPYHYKSCFQYLSIFPSKYKMRRTSLIRRWAAQGLVVARDGLAATDEAEHCFDQLIDRGLLLPADDTEPPSGKVKLCKVDPHVLSFITRLSRDDSRAAADSIDLPSALALRLSIPSGIQFSNKKRRASEGLKKEMDHHPATIATDEQGQGVAVLQQQDSTDDTMAMVKLLGLFPTSESGWIKVLDLEDCLGLKKKHLKNICNKIFQLKYLSLRNTGIDKLPKEINRLQDLETFDIRGTNIKSFPAKSILLQKLAHLFSGVRIDSASSKSFPAVCIPRAIGSMTNMQILSHVKVSDSEDESALDDLVRLQQLSKLGVVIHANQANNLLKVIGMLTECLSSLSVRISDDIGKVANLNISSTMIFSAPRSLASLTISGKIGGLPTWLKQLEQLSEITLCDTSLNDTDIRILGVLINLRFIRLLRESYNQKQLTFEKGFRNLEFLIIERSGTISAVHFEQKVAPKLEKIVWISTFKIENLGIDKLPGLKEIELTGDCDLNRIKQSIKANPCHPNLTHRPSQDNAAATSTSAANK
uniref:NB-ARC domain-containing protein n=1 Tax=Leersia perrieri TaxID=77586 RepID=A0A0D9XUR7_9ORYZ